MPVKCCVLLGCHHSGMSSRGQPGAVLRCGGGGGGAVAMAGAGGVWLWYGWAMSWHCWAMLWHDQAVLGMTRLCWA